jgi:hypothetical protein
MGITPSISMKPIVYQCSHDTLLCNNKHDIADLLD